MHISVLLMKMTHLLGLVTKFMTKLNEYAAGSRSNIFVKDVTEDVVSCRLGADDENFTFSVATLIDDNEVLRPGEV